MGAAGEVTQRHVSAAEMSREIHLVLEGAAHSVVFQPIVDLQTGAIQAHEALSRFPRLGNPPPDLVFAEAHRLGLGADFELRAVEIARMEAANRKLLGALAVNLSPQTLLSPAATNFVGGDLDGLIVELTEHQAFPNLDALDHVVATLRSHGALVAVDDAGSGYSGMGMLIGLRPDIIKLDRSLVSGIDHNSAQYYLASMLVEFSSQIGSTLLAEGVEEDGELVTLVNLGIELGQGWLFARPNQEPQTLPEEIVTRVRALTHKLQIKSEIAQVLEIAPLEPQPEVSPLSSWLRVRQESDGGYVIRRRHDLSTDQWLEQTSPLVVSIETPVEEILVRAMAREFGAQFEPVIFVDATMACLGVARIERLVMFLTSQRREELGITMSGEVSAIN
jgi:EAL domain-containing protein (putative c-di-GMP-specific phosphodiesterase class I)